MKFTLSWLGEHLDTSASVAEVVEAVNFNDPAQTVIAGSKAAVEKACEALKAAGAKRALPLPVSAPFHSSLMKPAADKLRERLECVELAAPRFPVLNNIDVALEVDADRIRDALYRQAFGPVRWVECVQAIKARGIVAVVECGPGFRWRRVKSIVVDPRANQPEFDFALRNMQITDNTSLNDILWLCMPVSRSELLETVRYRAGAPF